MTVRERLDRYLQSTGHVASKSLGQNFLINDRVVNKILEAVDASLCQNVIEVGPGPGALTDILIEKYPNYVALELDRRVSEYWRGKNVNLIEADALQYDWSLIAQNKNTVFVSNLPYQIAASLVIERSLQPYAIEQMILMFQKEVAQRIRALPATEEYGLLSVVAQSFWTIDTVSEAGPGDFFPAPKVASRVLRFKIITDDFLQNTNASKKQYLHFLKMSFQQRRKVLRSNLKSWLHDQQLEGQALLDWLAANKHSESARAEELSVKQFQNLFKELSLVCRS